MTININISVSRTLSALLVLIFHNVNQSICSERYNYSFPFPPLVAPSPGNSVEPTPSKREASVGNKVIAGELTTIRSHPYLVNIAFNGEHLCGGSYIHSDWVLTAAHCIYPDKGPLTCSMGMTFLKELDRQQRMSLFVIPHPSFNKEYFSNDIGLVRLKAPFELNVDVSLIRIATREPKLGDMCTVAGWGIRYQNYTEGISKHSYQLTDVHVPIIKGEGCTYGYAFTNSKPVESDKVLCARFEDRGFGTCQIDSGSPLICNKILTGIVSHGIGCVSDLPGLQIYSKVAFYSDWIIKSMLTAMKLIPKSVSVTSAAKLNAKCNCKGARVKPSSVVLLYFIIYNY